MKKTTLFILFVCSYSFMVAQFNQDAPWMKGFEKSYASKKANQKFNLHEVSTHFENYWETRDPSQKGSGYKPFKRWEDFWRHYTDAQGYIPTSKELWDTWKQHKAFVAKSEDAVANWESVGPYLLANSQSSISNLGRVNVLLPDPNNDQIIYAGAPAGGVWKTTDGGTTWNPMSDDLPQIGVSGIAIHPDDSDTIYIATGDDDAGDTNSAGVFKSIDGGLTWNETGLNPNNTPGSMNDIYCLPSDKNKVYVATNNGLYYSEDAAETWENILSGNIKDLKFKPGDESTIYAVTSDKFYKSTNGGTSFENIATGLPTTSSRFVIDVTPADANYLYLVSADNENGFQGVYKSIDSGTTFTKTEQTEDIFESTQAWYDLSLAVSDTDAEEIYVGVLNIWRSINGGNFFSKLNSWFVHDQAFTHADIHFLRFYNEELYAGTDGGFYKSATKGLSFVDLTQGMQIGQFYRISVGNKSSKRLAGGLQDNGGFGYTDANDWRSYHGGDGMDNAIDPNNENVYYGFTQNGGTLNKSSNTGKSRGGTWEGPEEGNWITPLEINSEGVLYAGYESLYSFSNETFTKESEPFAQGKIDALEIDKNNDDIIYVGVNSSLYKSTDRGKNFTLINAFNSNVNSVESHSSNSDYIYVTTSGSGSRGIFRSSDGGENFENITFDLPFGQPFFDIVHQDRHSLNPLFVGTSLGVFRMDDSSDSWEPYLTNLPTVPVRDLEISLEDAKLIAATYGRGVWQTDIPVELPASEVRLISVVSPIGGILYLADENLNLELEVSNDGANEITAIEVNYTIDEETPIIFNWTGNIASGASQIVSVPISVNGSGLHSINITIDVENDVYSENNSGSTQFVSNTKTTTNTVNDFEVGTDKLLTYNEGDFDASEWIMGIPNGTVLKETASGERAYNTNLNGNYGDLKKSYLVTRFYDLSEVTFPALQFEMAYDLELNFDILYVEYSIDSGVSWNILGSSEDENWYNSNRTNATSGINNDCQNCPGAQWTGTDAVIKRYSHRLTDIETETNVAFRFVLHTDPAENNEGIVIDDLIVIETTIDDADDDKDGVPNSSDSCPNTEEGAVVNVDGCEIFSLPAGNFQLAINSETCRSSDNGSIVVTADAFLTYTAVLKSGSTKDTKEFNSSVTFSDLTAGTYEVCITVEGQPDYETCFEVNISEPEPLSVYSKMESQGKAVALKMSGGNQYLVTLNGETTFTTEDEIQLDLKPGLNAVEVATGVSCQGVYKEVFVVAFEGVRMYPNPVSNGRSLYLTTGGIQEDEIEVAIYSMVGSKVYQNTLANTVEKRISVSVDYLAKGVYVLQMKTREFNKSFNLIID